MECSNEFRIVDEIYSSNANIKLDSFDITLFNLGSSVAYINGVPIYPFGSQYYAGEFTTKFFGRFSLVFSSTDKTKNNLVARKTYVNSLKND